MKIKNFFLLNDDFTKVLQNFTTYKIAVTKAFALFKILKDVEEQKKILENTRLSLFKKFGESKDGGNSYSILPENNVVYQKEITEILNMDCEIPHDKIKLDCRIEDKDGKEILLSINDIALLKEIFDFE